jgi:RNA polymerase sigma-70 factor (ECF subfamily)
MDDVVNERKGRTKPAVSAEEKAIIERCKRGELSAFNDLVKKYEKQVYNAIGSFRGDASFRTWLFRITTNVFLDERKRARAHPHTSLDEYVNLEESSVSRQIEDTAPTPDVVTEGKERAQILEDAIRTLPEYQRAVVTLYHTQQKSYEEIAEIMDQPIGTVKSRLNRARLALKEKLSPMRELFDT